MTASELVAKVKNLPPVPNAALRLIGLLDKTDTSNDDVVQVIRCDNVLTAKLLRACNSPYFGFSEPVSSVDQAVLVLGHQQILHIVLTLAFGSAMAAPQSGNSTESNALWHHSLTSAMAAEVVVNSGLDLGVEAPVAFTAGLLHDIGKLVVSQILDADKQSAILGYISMNGVPRVEAEHVILGTDHSEVGAWLLKSWNLPDDIVEAVANHHRPVLEPRPQLSVVAHLANCTAHLANSAPGCEASAVHVNNEVMEQLGITPDMLGRLVVEVRDSSESVGRFMAMA